MHWHRSRQLKANRRTFVQVTMELVYYMDRLLVSTVDDFNDLHNWIGTDWHWPCQTASEVDNSVRGRGTSFNLLTHLRNTSIQCQSYVNPILPILCQSIPIRCQSCVTCKPHTTSEAIIKNADWHRIGTHWHRSRQSQTNRRTFVQVTRELVYYRDPPKCLDGGWFRWYNML